jgi:formamidopyrimidine-DNA glycosylase
MPELPEVETTRRALEPVLVGEEIATLDVRDARLRWPVDPGLGEKLERRRVCSLKRRGKYLLIETDAGTLIWHLGMSGSLRFLEQPGPPKTHDHVDIVLSNGARVRFNDPRRFGSVSFTPSPEKHWLLEKLGVEPLDAVFDGAYLKQVCRGRRVAIKQLLMNSQIVTGVGNIYANESLFHAGIHPLRAAGRISAPRLARLADAVKGVLQRAIELGGTTLRDYVSGDGRPGYFQQTLAVYGRDDEPCITCGTPIKLRVVGQRATYYCPRCQR